MIPPFDSDGNLPPGIHDADWSELAARYETTSRRQELVAGLERALSSLLSAGCQRAYIDGSFVTEKEDPNDFDACWEAPGVDASKLDPVLLDFTDNRAAQKRKYGGELFPAEVGADPAGTRFLDFFQQDKTTGKPKGIVGIDLGGLP